MDYTSQKEKPCHGADLGERGGFTSWPSRWDPYQPVGGVCFELAEARRAWMASGVARGGAWKPDRSSVALGGWDSVFILE